MNVMLLAAGEGTRFRPHTEILPKPAIPLCGIPLLYYSFTLIQDLKPKNIVINTFHLPREIHLLGDKLKQRGFNVIYSDEKESLLGSGGGIAKAKKHLEDNEGFLVINADEVIFPQKESILTDFINFSKNSASLATLMVMKHPDAGSKFNAVWTDSTTNEIIDFGKTKPASINEVIPYHFIGPMYFKNEIFDRLKIEPSNIIHDILKKAMSEGKKVTVYPVECCWYETGNLHDYLNATNEILNLFIEKHPFANKLWNHFLTPWTLVSSNNYIILKHKQSYLDPLVKVKGFTILDEGSEIMNCDEIENLVCFKNVHLKGETCYRNSLALKS